MYLTSVGHERVDRKTQEKWRERRTSLIELQNVKAGVDFPDSVLNITNLHTRKVSPRRAHTTL